MTSDLLLGRVLGDTFEIEQPLGEGGFGAVYVARHVRTGRKYAVKVLRADRPGASAATVKRFRREADALAALGHPGIVAIHDFAQTPDGIDYLVMDLLRGEDLSSRLERVGRLSVEQTLDLAQQVGAALSAAHREGIVHRDLKPANVFLTQATGVEERAMVLDFGLAKMTGGDGQENLTASGVAMGTPIYMSPEQANGGDIDFRTDQYAMGVMMYELLVGAPPFEAPTMAGLLVRIMTQPPPPLRDRATHVPPHVAAAVHRALSKDPAARFPSIDAFVRALSGEAAPLAETREAMAVGPRAGSSSDLPQTRAVAVQTPEGGTALPGHTPQTWDAAHRTTRRETRPGSGLIVVGMLALALVFVVGGGVALYSMTKNAPSTSGPVAQAPPGQAPVEARTPDPIAQDQVLVAPTEEALEGPTPEDGTPGDEPGETAEEVPGPSGPSNGNRRRRRATAPASGQETDAPTPPAASPTVAAPAVVPVMGLRPEQVQAYRDQVQTYQAQTRELEGLLNRLTGLRRDVRGLAQGREPRMCQADLRAGLPSNSDVPVVVSQAQRLRNEVTRACERFDKVRNPPDNVQNNLRRISSTLDRAEQMTQATFSSNEPQAVAAQIRGAIGRARQALAGVEEGRRPFPCNVSIWGELRELSTAGNSYSGAAAERVYRLRDQVCNRLGMDSRQLRQAESTFLERLDDVEGTLRSSSRTNERMIAQFQALIP